ncbi:MAG: tetratricopeptide repeat protein [Limisphaerales bacterium]
MSRARQLLQRHGRWPLALVATVLGLLACEGIMRGIGLAPPVHAIWLNDEGSFYRRSTNPILGYEIRPEFSRETRRGRASSNAHGFRDRERSLAKPPDVRRVIMLGDSVVEGISYVDDENTLSRHLEKLHPDGKTEVLNLGISGYCTLSEVTLLEQRGLAFQPDIVLLMFVYNDFDNFNPEHTIGGGVVDRPAWTKHLFEASELFRYSALKFNWFEFAAESDPQQFNRSSIGNNNVVDGLRRLRELANEHQFQVLIVPWPKFTDINIGYPNPSGPPPLLIERLAAMNGLPIKTLADAFPKVDNPRQEFTAAGDGMHPNAVAAEIVARRLREMIDVGLPPPPYQVGMVDADAIEIAKRASREALSPEELDVRAYLALGRQGREEEAFEVLRDMLNRDPQDLLAAGYLGRSLFDSGHVAEARPYLEQVLRSDPSQAGSRSRLAYLLNDAGNGEAARQLLFGGMKVNPKEPRNHQSLAAISITNGQFELAERHLDITRQLNPRLPMLPALYEQLRKAR